MELFSAEEKAAIEAAINRAERKTSGEIVVVAAVASGRYYGVALMWAALLALTVPLPLIFLTSWAVEHIYLAQLGAFALFVLLIQSETVRLALVPAPLKRARAHEKAVEQFLVQNLHTTEGRTGILIYVSFAERFAEVLADAAVYKKVTPGTWVAVIDTLVERLSRDERSAGFIAAIEACGKILAEHFPPRRGDKDELPNHLIVLDADWIS
jgi:putative membrane protein